MWDTIRDLVAEGSTIMLTTQYLDEADALAGRIAVIDHGRKVAEGTPSQLKTQIGTSSLRVQMAEGADTADALAVAAKVTGDTPVISPTGSGFSVTLSHANQATDVLVALRNHRLDIANLTVEQPSLDEVFFALTGHTSETPVSETEASTI
jgi:ABC-2 type transport system ATP-binding protein